VRTRSSLFGRCDAVAAWLFASGYRFFLPYLALYLGAWWVDAPVEALKDAFLVLHGTTLALLIAFVAGRWHALRQREAWFWLALAFAFVARSGARAARRSSPARTPRRCRSARASSCAW
jgi:hypothetical protein